MAHHGRRKEANNHPTIGGLCLPSPQLDLRFSGFATNANNLEGTAEEEMCTSHNTTTESQPQSYFPFLSLPGELRNIVYQYYSRQEFTIELHYALRRRSKHWRRVLVREDPRDTEHLLALARTCRQVYQEAVSFVYSANRFDFTHPWALSRFLSSFRSLSHISRVKISANLNRVGRRQWSSSLVTLGRAPKLKHLILVSEDHSYKWYKVTLVSRLARITSLLLTPFVDARIASAQHGTEKIFEEDRHRALSVVDLHRLRFRWELPNGGVWWACATEDSKRRLQEKVADLIDSECRRKKCGLATCKGKRQGDAKVKYQGELPI